MSNKKKIIIFIAFFLFFISLPIGLCKDAGSIGGYNIIKMAEETARILEEKKLLEKSSADNLIKLLSIQQVDPIASSSSIIDFYDQLCTLMLKKGIISQDEINLVKTSAAESGGLKIGGYNAMILAASFLDILVKKDIIPLTQAQLVLDTSKAGE